MATNDHGFIEIWDIEKAKHCFNLSGHKSSVWSVSHLKGTTQLLSGSIDSLVKLWVSIIQQHHNTFSHISLSLLSTLIEL